MDTDATRQRPGQGRCLSRGGYRGRVRSGCLTCRARRVKCDELRPICHNCSRLRRSCVYKPRGTGMLQPRGTGMLQPRAETVESESDITASANQVLEPPIEDRTVAAAAAASSSASAPASVLPSSASPDLLPDDGNCILTETFQLHGVTTSSSLEDTISAGGLPSLDILTLDVTTFSDTRLHDAAIKSIAMGGDGSGGSESGGASLSALISRNIELTTTIDILSICDASLKPMFSFFLEEVDCPLITPYDEVNWRYMKEDIVDLGDSHPAIASAISAVSALYKGQLYSLPLSSRAVSLYHSAKLAYEKLLVDMTQDFSIILVVTLLLCLFEVVHYETTPILKEPVDIFIHRLAAWARDQPQLSPLSSRIITWLRLLYATTVRGGGMGLISDSVFRLLPDCKGNPPLAAKSRPEAFAQNRASCSSSSDNSNIKNKNNNRPDAATQIYNILSAPIFEFYYQLQVISGRIARLTHYHRSRITGFDQEEVDQQIAHIKSQLHDLWERRSPTQRQTPQELHGCLAPHIAKPLIKLIGICTAAYYAEFIEMARVLGDPISESPHSKHARAQIRAIIDGDWNAYDDGKLNPGYLRPLFLCAIECMDQDECRWAVKRLEQIKNPICRSEFFASFGKALSDAQLQRGRRVTSKYFCIWHFGVSPPFM